MRQFEAGAVRFAICAALVQAALGCSSDGDDHPGPVIGAPTSQVPMTGEGGSGANGSAVAGAPNSGVAGSANGLPADNGGAFSGVAGFSSGLGGSGIAGGFGVPGSAGTPAFGVAGGISFGGSGF